MGETFSENQRLEVLIMRENKLKWVPYACFWENIQSNTSLLKINVSKTDLSDRVLEKLCLYLQNPNIKLADLDLSRNSITDLGLQNLAETLTTNQTVKFLNLGSNLVRDVGLRSLVAWLSHEKCVLE
jgi:Ran GTPase-activating protein (RanGAP) involved in mRNA processing and transport